MADSTPECGETLEPKEGRNPHPDNRSMELFQAALRDNPHLAEKAAAFVKTNYGGTEAHRRVIAALNAVAAAVENSDEATAMVYLPGAATEESLAFPSQMQALRRIGAAIESDLARFKHTTSLLYDGAETVEELAAYQSHRGFDLLIKHACEVYGRGVIFVTYALADSDTRVDFDVDGFEVQEHHTDGEHEMLVFMPVRPGDEEEKTEVMEV